MIQSKTLASGIADGIRIKETVLMAAAAVIFPFIVHFIPAFDGIPAGARLLAMFYAPFIAVLFFNSQVALTTAILAPVLNHMITGMPKAELIPVLTIELFLFALACLLFKRNNILKYAAAPLAYIAAKLVSSSAVLVYSPLSGGLSADRFFVNSVANAVPGLIIMLLIGVAVIRMKRS